MRQVEICRMRNQTMADRPGQRTANRPGQRTADRPGHAWQTTLKNTMLRLKGKNRASLKGKIRNLNRILIYLLIIRILAEHGPNE